MDNASLKPAAKEPILAIQPTAEIHYQCGELRVEFKPGKDGNAEMRMADVVYALEQVPAASGAKYQNPGDSSTFFWTKGELALLNIQGRHLPECSTIPSPEKPAKPYSAQGNEPGWHVEIVDKRIYFSGDYGRQKINLAVGTDETRSGVRTLRGRKGRNEIIITISPELCRDTMSGELFAHKVQLEHNRKSYQGCGQSLIREIVWRLEDLNGGGVIDDSRITLIFGVDGRLHGNSGCNLYSGRYAQEGKTLKIDSNIMATERACAAEAMMRQEQIFLRMLPKLTTMHIDKTGALTLDNSAGESLLFRSVERFQANEKTLGEP